MLEKESNTSNISTTTSNNLIYITDVVGLKEIKDLISKANVIYIDVETY